MKRFLSVLLVICFTFVTFAGVESTPTRLDNTRSLGMGRAYTANGLDRIGVFFYNPAAIQNVEFSKPTLFNFTMGISMDWKDIYDAIDNLDFNESDFDVSSTDAFDATTYVKYGKAYDAAMKTLTEVNSLYGENGSFYFQNLSNWTNNGLGFSFFAKGGFDFGINKSAASSFLTISEIELINAGKAASVYLESNPGDTVGAVAAGTATINGVATDGAYFNSTTEFPGIDVKNYLDLGVQVTKGFTKELDKSYGDAKDKARLDFGVSAKMIWRSNFIEKGSSIDGISVGAADFVANEDVESRFDSIEKTRMGVDVGALLHTKDSMNTRIGLSVMDIFSTDFNSDFDAPDMQVNLGVALRPFRFAENTLMRKVDVAVDLQDITNSDKDFDQQLKIGVEGRTTSMLTWRIGYTDKKLSQGIDFRLGSLGSFTIAHYYDIVDRFGREFESENYAIQFKAMF